MNADDTDLAGGDEAGATPLDDGDRDLDMLCERWVSWRRARGLNWPAPIHAVDIVRRGGGTRPLDASAEVSRHAVSMAAFHIAYTCQPNSLEKQVFDLYYVARVTPVKSAASALGIGRAHFYRLLTEFRRRVDLAARAFETNGVDATQLLDASHENGIRVNNDSVS